MHAPYIITTALPLEDPRQHVKTWRNLVPGWVLTTSDAQSLTFTRTVKPSIALTILLLLLWVFPGVLYLIFGWRKESCNIYFKQDKGKTTVTVEADGTTKSPGRSLQRFLSQHDSSVPEPSQPAPPPTTKGFEVYFLYVASAVALLAVLSAVATVLLA
jgi:hypothetical protein